MAVKRVNLEEVDFLVWIFLVMNFENSWSHANFSDILDFSVSHCSIIRKLSNWLSKRECQKVYTWRVKNNGNRTEWSAVLSVIRRVTNEIGRPRSRSLICQSRVWLQTELDDTKSCYKLIITVTISENNEYITR